MSMRARDRTTGTEIRFPLCTCTLKAARRGTVLDVLHRRGGRLCPPLLRTPCAFVVSGAHIAPPRQPCHSEPVFTLAWESVFPERETGCHVAAPRSKRPRGTPRNNSAAAPRRQDVGAPSPTGGLTHLPRRAACPQASRTAFPGHNKTPRLSSRGFVLALPIFPGRLQPSIVSRSELN